jgi:hypothetical protein
MNNLKHCESYEKFHTSTNFIEQAYYFFFSCLPDEDETYPCVINSVHFMSAEHVRVYENELSYSFLTRIFGALEEYCNKLGLQDNQIQKVIKNSARLTNEVKENYTHVRKLRHVIMHGNGVGELIRDKYVSYTKDHNGDLQIRIDELDGFVEIITLIAIELSIYCGEST